MATPQKALPKGNEFFGFGRQPLLEYFRPEGEDSANDLRYSPQARAMFREDDAIIQAEAERQRALQQQQRGWAAEDRAQEFSDTAPASSFDKMLGALTPELMSQPGVAPYMQLRQRQERPNRYSDQVLGPSIAAKIKEPHMLARYRKNMEEGMSALDSWEDIKNAQYNEGHEVALAKAGYTQEEREALKENGMFNPLTVTSAIERGKNDPSKDRPVPVEMANKYFEIMQLDPARAKQYAQFNRDAGFLFPGFEKTQVKIEAQPSAAAAAAGPQASAPAKVQLKDLKTPEQKVVESGFSKIRETEQRDIDEAWSEARKPIVKRISEVYKDINDWPGVAAGILRGDEMAPTDEEAIITDDFGRVVNTPYDLIILKKLGLDPNAPAFSEPHNRRWGTQEVTNRELLKYVAKDILDAAGVQTEAETAVPAPTQPVVADPKLQSALDKYAPKK